MRRLSSSLTGAVAVGTAALTLSLAILNGDITPATQPAATAPTTAPTTAPAPMADAGQLIKQLGSDNADDRESAQKQLVEMGPSAVGALKKAAEEDDDPEIRSRASAALAQMKDHDNNDTSLITLHLKDAPAQDVLNAIGVQAHAQFIGYSGSGAVPGITGRQVTIDADNKPFWDVLTDVCTQTNVCPVLDTPGHNSIRLFPVVRNWLTQAPHQVVGPYWIGVAGVSRTRSIDLMGPQAVDDLFSIRLIIYPEPKLAVTQVSELKLFEAVDDAGNSLMPRPQAALPFPIRTNRQFTHMIDARLTYPDQPGKRISILRGQVTAMLAQDLQRYEVDDVLGTPKVTNPLTKCTVKATVIKRTGTDYYQVSLECTRDGLSDEKWSAMMNRMSDISLEDADGHPLMALGVSMATSSTESSFTGTSLFSRIQLGMAVINKMPVIPQPAPAKVGEPKKLVWNVATSLKSVTVPVVFKDLPMP